jgi:hypothetical protein
MRKVNTDEQFFSRFLRLQGKIQTISGVFQNPDIELSDDEVILWNMAADDAKLYLDELISEGRSRVGIKLESEFNFYHRSEPHVIYRAKYLNEERCKVEWIEDGEIESATYGQDDVLKNIEDGSWIKIQ